jgi:superfamily II DNA or RNA helicase
MSSIGYYGLNVFVHHLINVTGGKDATMLIQKIGRGLRKSDDKERLEYHDFILTGNRWLENHSKERMETLRAEGHKVVVERAL